MWSLKGSEETDADKWLQYLTVDLSQQLKFTIELEQDNAVPFLDILVTRNQKNTFMTSIERKLLKVYT